MAAGKYWFLVVISLLTRAVVFVLVTLASLPALAESPMDELTDILTRLARMEASFEQSVQGPRGELVEYTTGQFLLERPLFRWQVAEPYPQVIVSDGATLRIYDPDLEQVTERPVTEALAATPLGLLAQQEIRLEGSFTAQIIPGEVLPGEAVPGEIVTAESAQRHFRLTSTDENAPYQSIDLWVEEGDLARIEVLDHFGQKLRVAFIDEPIEPWGDSPFQLELPDSVEVVRG